MTHYQTSVETSASGPYTGIPIGTKTNGKVLHLPVEQNADGLVDAVNSPDARRHAERAVSTVEYPTGPVVDVQVRTLNLTYTVYVNGQPDKLALPLVPNRSVRVRYLGENGNNFFYGVDVEAYPKRITDRKEWAPKQVQLNTWYNTLDSMEEIPISDIHHLKKKIKNEPKQS